MYSRLSNKNKLGKHCMKNITKYFFKMKYNKEKNTYSYSKEIANITLVKF